MKILRLRKKIIIRLSISLVLMLALGAVIYYLMTIEEDNKKRVNKVKSKTSDIERRLEDIENEVNQTKKYKNIWKTISEKEKSTKGIKVDAMNSLLEKTAERYNISKPKIQVIIPKELTSGIFKRKTISMNLSTASLNFQSVNDTRALLFISDFINSLPGYVVINSLDITRKSGSYSDADLISISKGKYNNSLVSVKLDFYWYAYKEKKIKKRKPRSKEGDLGIDGMPGDTLGESTNK